MVAVLLIGIWLEGAVVERVGNLVVIRVLRRCRDQVLRAVRCDGTVRIGAAGSMLPLAGLLRSAEGATRAVRVHPTRGPELLDAASGASQDLRPGRPAAQGCGQALEVLTRGVARRQNVDRLAVRGGLAWPEHHLADTGARLTHDGLTELPRAIPRRSIGAEGAEQRVEHQHPVPQRLCHPDPPGRVDR